MSRRNEFLDHDVSDESELDDGYDSEAVEISKTSRGGVSRSRDAKRRKLSHSASESDEDVDATFTTPQGFTSSEKPRSNLTVQPESSLNETEVVQRDASDYEIKSAAAEVHNKHLLHDHSKKRDRKEKTPGVIYLSSLPPYLKPSALRNLLIQRGFGPITRLFLTPSSKSKHSSKKNSRQLYSEGWIEFESRKTARRCAEALNAQLIGGRKGGFYHDDMWNMKYLKGMSWDELMAGIREEKREEEGRRDEERRKLAAETKAFVEGVEEGRKVQGMQRKRKAQKMQGALHHEGDGDGGGANDVKRTWRQYEVAGGKKDKQPENRRKNDHVDGEVQQVLAKIF